jgi:hypothetical protein
MLGPRQAQQRSSIAAIETNYGLHLNPTLGLPSKCAARRLPEGFPHALRRVRTPIDIDPQAAFDTVLYIDVLEHIDDDRGEVSRASAHLAPSATDNRPSPQPSTPI